MQKVTITLDLSEAEYLQRLLWKCERFEFSDLDEINEILRNAINEVKEKE